MDRTRTSLALLLVALAVVACSSTSGGGNNTPTPTATATPTPTPAGPGRVQFTISCGGLVCGKTGNLVATVSTCGGAPILSGSAVGVTLTMGVMVVATLGNITPGSMCASSYLDVNTNATLDTDDGIASLPAVHVTVTGGGLAPAAITLDTIKP